MATVTVFVPTYNRPDMIRESIESALAQTYEDFVLLVGDNGGSPLTEAVVRSYDDPRVQYVRHEQNLGGMGNWLELIRLAETPLVASLHDDDTWHPTFLEKLVPPMLADPGVSMAFCDFWCADDAGEPLLEHTAWASERTKRSVLPAGRYSASFEDGVRMIVIDNAPQPAYAAVLRRSAVMDTVFPPEIDPVYDLWLSYRIHARGEGFYFIPERLTNYRVWQGSLTAAGYGRGIDAILGHIVAENLAHDELTRDLRHHWSLQRYYRARRLLDDPSASRRSREEFRLATPDLAGRQWLISEVAGRSQWGWEAARRSRQVLRSVRSVVRPDGVSRTGLPERLTRPDAAAKRLAT